MAVVWIPSQMRELTGGLERVVVPGDTVRQVIERLEQRYPGLKDRLCEQDRLRSNISLVVDGQVSAYKLRHPIDDSSELHFLPAISGGSTHLTFR